ncbi:transmembrane protein 179-like [Liolophura sinensis]|uniref:transmembrane protein 179-like n=1 Tax=Liolophura sinensis TaxID=3198878 RepID=UPI00315904B3
MAVLGDVHLLTQTLLYFAGCIAGLVAVVPLGITSLNFDGNCILYSDVKWVNATYFTCKFGNSSACHFPIYLLVFGCILYGAAMGGYNMYAYCTSRKDCTIGSQMWVMPFIMTNSLLVVTLFIASCLVSVGFGEFCNGFVDGAKTAGNTVINSCVDGQKLQWKNKNTGEEYTGDTYFNFLTTAQTVSWACFLIWTAQVALCLLRFWRNRRGRSSGQVQIDHGPETITQNISTIEPTA